MIPDAARYQEKAMENKQNYDVVIIGGGAAGMTAAQYAARANLRALVIEEKAEGGQAVYIDRLENYPGVPDPVNGVDFALAMKKQAEQFGAEFMRAKVTGIEKSGDAYEISTENTGATGAAESGRLHAPTVILATGAEHKKLGVPGENEYYGRGVSYCATCDGPFFRNKRIVVVGGGDAACDEASFLARLTDDVTMIHRKPQFRAQKAVADNVLSNPKITVLFNTIVTEIKGGENGAVASITLKNVRTGETAERGCDAVFIFIGMLPRTELAATVRTDENGYIATDERMETSMPGVFAAGDLRAKPFRQVITAAADGAVAAHSAAEHIASLKGTSYNRTEK